MKSTKLATSLLVSALVLGAMAPAAFAEDGNAKVTTGTGTIQYKENTKPVGPIDPENPDVDVDVDEEEGKTNTDEGTMLVDFVSNLKFGIQDISTKQQTYDAKATKVKVTDKVSGAVTEEDRGNYVQITDQRADDAARLAGWTLSAQVTQGFTNIDGDVLKGASIAYTNPFVNSTQTDKDSLTSSVVTLNTTADGEGATTNSETFLSAAKGTGFGTYTVEFGRPGEETHENSVKLTVPANTALSIDKAYTAKIKWTLAAL